MKILHNNTEILDIQVDDSSYRYRAIKGDHNLTLYFSLAEHVEIPVGAYCVYQNETYTLEKPESLKMKHSRNFEYTVIFESPQAKAQRFKFRNPVDGRLKFSLTAKPIEHLQMFVDNMNQRDSGWSVGHCVDSAEITLSYNHVFCNEALTQMADELETEYEFVGKQVSLGKVEYNKDNPLPLSYGRGNGFKPDVGRSNYEDKIPIEILYTQGSDQNIDPSKYGSQELLLPKSQQIRFDGIHFEDEEGFDSSKARAYMTDAYGYSVRRADKQLSSLAEDSLDCSGIYPSRVGTVSAVSVVDAANNFYDIVDDTIPANLNFEDYLIAGETMTVIFQTGMLAGREFEVKYIHEANGGKAARRFEIVPQEIDGVTMPNNTFKPVAGQDTYAVFNCMLPDAYICDNSTKTGASWQMFREAIKYLFDNEEQKFSFTGELDGIWAKQDWLNIGGKIKLGGFVQFTDERFQHEGVLVRIIGIKDYINNPHSPEIELSNSTVGRSVSSDLLQIGSNEVLTEDLHKEAIQFTKRRYRDAKETIEMLGEALLDNFTNSINPITVQTMAMLVGDESLQFQFVNNTTNPTPVAHNVVYNPTTKVLSVPSGIIQHLTLGIDSISSSHTANEYKYWTLAAFETPTLTDGDKKYYLYAKVSKTAQTGVFYMSETAIGIEDVSGYYHLLMGVLNSEFEDVRSYASLYGFTEVMPGRITTDKIVSSTGNSFFDMLNEAMKLGDVFDFNSQGDGKLRIKGTIVQSESGDESPIGVYRGMYNANYTYYNGDEVAFTQNGLTSTYRFIYATPTKGIDPTNATHWQVRAAGVKGDKGDVGSQGIPGEAGSDGRTSYFHVKYSDYSDGTNMNETGGKYIGSYVDYTEVDSTDKTKYTWVLVKGAQGDKGDQGIAGINGENGKTSYLHIAYADSADGQTNFSVSDSTCKLYIGQYTDFEQTDSSDPTKYKWTKIKGEQGIQGLQGLQGEQGEQGLQGAAGSDGRTSYFHIKYAPVQNPTAEQMTETPSYYVGTYVDFTQTDSTDPLLYTWARFQGFDGEQGIPGVNGEDGQTSYLHIKYSNDGGQTFSSKVGLRLVRYDSLRLTSGGGFRFADDNIGEVAGLYIGQYVDHTQTDSTDVFRYTWTKIKGEQGDKGDTGDKGDQGIQGLQGLQGEQGEQGLQGAAGSDGRTSYFHVKYSDNADGTNMNETGGKYIGTYVDYTEADSSDKTKYTWVLVKGAQGDKGDQGIAGTNGEDGTTSYLHIKYSNDGGQTFSSKVGLRLVSLNSLRLTSGGGFRLQDDNIGEVPGAYIGQYVDNVQADSTDVFRYTWTKIKGDVGDFYEYRYAKNGSTTTAPDIATSALNPAGWTTTVPTVSSLEYLWTTIAKKSGDGATLLQNWSTPVRITPKDGDKGDKGESPALVFRGVYDAATTYYGNNYRVDAVKYNGAYYVARIDAGTFYGAIPTSATKWNTFGAQFESVATNLLLAENANIAGWVFRNNRLESQSGNVYLDGATGKVRIAGTIQLSTAYNGNISDVNLFYLPAITATKNLTMGYEKEDVGKVCRLYNSSPFGGATYRVYVYAFGITSDETGGTKTDSTIGFNDGMNYYVLIPPQSTVELTCYEMPRTYKGVTYDVVARWDITSRFDTDSFRKEAAKGRFPRMLAMGRITSSENGVYISGYYYDGRSLSSLITVSRTGVGAYHCQFASGLFPAGYKVFGIGYGADNMKLSVDVLATTNFDAYVSDDSARNDGTVDFMILDPNWWFNMQ